MSGQINTMQDIIGYAAKTYGENAAVRYKVKKEIVTKTFCDVKADSEAFSRALEAFGMLGKHVAVIGPTTYEWIISYFGTANSGSVIVPLDAQLPAAEVCELLNRADISMLVYDSLRKDGTGNVPCSGAFRVYAGRGASGRRQPGKPGAWAAGREGEGDHMVSASAFKRICRKLSV